ncbi:low affinity iron permease family protein [Nocardioides aestuarii]|uniref:Low affinity iron permease family protein n=1 Tax=Nocardioides aestuarii TaxID=252231 RepID=A0ABW4TNN7_9ACTN
MGERNEAVKSRRGDGDRRNQFERFVTAVNDRVSRAPFFFVIVAALVLWAASFPLWSSSTKWELALHTGSSVLSLLLLVLLENAGRRNNEAEHEKLNVIAEALSDLMESRAAEDADLHDSVTRLRDAVGLEKEH